MRHNTPVTTMAAAIALALALLVGVLLPSDSVVHAADPEFDADTTARSVPENTPPGVNIGAPISATDSDETGATTAALEFGNTLTYKLEGTDAALFDIDASTGQLITKVPLDAEGDGPYSVTVTVDDGETRETACTTCTQTVAISVTDVPNSEVPLAPVMPTVVSWDDPGSTDTDESTTSLRVIWHPPDNRGRPNITGYSVQYKESTATSFTPDDHSGTDTTTTITGLEADTSYDVRVQAANGDGSGPWSLVGTGSTNNENNQPPKFHETDGSIVELDVPENTPAGEDVDSPVTATDGDTASLTYGIDGPDKDLFNFDTRTGQIRTKEFLDHEDPGCGYIDGATPSTQCIYRVTVTVVDGKGGSDARAVQIEVDDRNEPALAPARPTVRPTEKSSTSLVVSWDEPDNTRRPPITGYDVEYRKGSDPFSDDNCRDATADANCDGITDTTTTITGLDSNTTYEVRVRTTNAERVSVWSTSGTGKTGKANHQPIFDDRPHSGTGSTRNSEFTVSRRIDENPGSVQSVGRVVADDEDNDRLTYKLVVSADTDDAREELSKFTINETTGEIRTKVGVTYNYEDIAASGTCDPLTEATVGSDRCYTVKVEVRDGLDDDRVEVKETDADDSITLKIGVRDREEPPEKPTVTVTSPVISGGVATLGVFWDAKNTGPEITSYDVQYRKGSDPFSNDHCLNVDIDDNCDGITGTTTTIITGLDEDTSYSVQVRARNAEGVSIWSSPSPSSVKTNKGTNDPPTFTDIPADGQCPVDTLCVPENTTGNIGNPVNASDTISTSLTYSLGGRDAASFRIVPSSGQIQTRSSLNHEDSVCGYVATADPTVCTYTVRVKVDDRAGGSVSKEVTISVTDVEEAPSAPTGLTVRATKDTGWSLDVSWNAPTNTGKPPITDYDIQYRKDGDANDTWQNWPHGTADDTNANNTDTSATITRRAAAVDADPLEPRTRYEVRVRAKNGEDDTGGNWSSISQGTTGASNRRPSFDRTDALITLRVDESTRSRQNVGSAVSASDADGNRLTYSLEGPGIDSFSIVPSSGQIQTKSGVKYDYESRQSYSVTVRVDDGQRKDNSSAVKSVTIMVDDVRETPPAPAAPKVAGIPGSTDSVEVTWGEPANTGPSIDEYEVHYSGGGLVNVRWPHNRADRSTIITGLESGTRYEVQVRARSDEGTSEWSRSGSGMPNPDVANRNPRFSGGSRSLSVPENEPAGTEVGAPIAATDQDGDTLTYTLEGADSASFDILSTSDGGQIRTSVELNHEEKASYSVTVRVIDGRGGSAAANVTIRVTDVDGEAPDTPFAPTVTAVSSTSLQVSWDAPDNQGPPITDYDFRYQAVTDTNWTEVTNTTITGTTETIDGLTPSTPYDVEVRAKNAEGTSEWSNPGNGATNAPDANNLPVFTEGTSATRSVSAASPAGTNIGEPIAATDADAGDTITYSLEGRDAANFDIDSTNGQLRTSAPLIVGETYTVTVVADDTKDTTRISVSIEATAAPPNNPPVFSDGASTTRTVRDDATAGRNVGSPVSATDADTGDTITYTLEGTDQASFGIVASSGQIQTSAALDASTKATYSVTVRATDNNGGTATIAVTITVTAAPVSYGCATLGAVTDTSNTGLVGDCEALMASRNALEGNARLNWSAGTPIADWDGVYLRGTPSRVTFLILRREGLDGTIPADLGRLDRLTILNLHSNNLSGSIPAEIGNLTNLEQLLLHNNNLSGSFPDLSRLSRLKKLWFSGANNRIGEGGGIPTWLNRLTSLEELNLWGNEMGGTIPNLSGLTRLKLLKLQYNSLTGSIPAWFGNMNSLGGLYLHVNDLTGNIPPELGRLTRLRRLWLDRNELGGTIPPALSGMSNLGTLNLHTNRLTGSIPSQLENLSRLQHLALHNNTLDGIIPSQLGNLSELTRLAVSNNRLSGPIPSQLGDLDKLTLLWLSQNQLTGTIPSELGDLGDTLINIKLANNNFDANACVPSGLANVRTNDYSEAGLSTCS